MARQKEMTRAIDKEFEEADDTGVLDISGRNLRQFPVIPGELLDYTYVFEADFSNNRFDKLPKEIMGFKALVKLNCHHNSIRWLLEELYLLGNLKEVDISRNFLTKIPSEICGMNLYSMNFNNNRLLSLPKEIGKLKNLQFLDLSCNSISELPESFFSLLSLRHLNLHRNNLRDLPDDICQLTELQHLDISSNLLTRLPITLRHMESLQVFTADDNPLESPPPQICCRGYVHLCKYLETLEKKGSDHHLFLSGQRDESLRRRKERQQKKLSYNRPLSESTPVRNGGEQGMGLLDEMSNFIPTLREKDGERTPTGGLHWSVAQYITSEKSSNMSSQSKEEYREANYRLYMQQEGHKKPPEPCPSSPAGSSSLNEVSTTPTLSGPPKRMSDENVYRSSTSSSTSGSPSSDSSRPTITGRSLSNEKFPRSGSWNSHMRVSSPVLPSKYVAASERQSEEKAQTRPPSTGLSSKSTDNISNAEAIPAKTSITKKDSAPAKTSPPSGKPGKRPAPLDPNKKSQSMSAPNSHHVVHIAESTSQETSV